VKPVVAKIRKLSRLRPTLAFVLGSGFNHVLSEVDIDAEIPYAKLPGFPKPSVAGHDGRLVIGKLGGTTVLVLSGRAHYYEGHAMERVTFAVRVLAAYGITDLLLTNAAGGINRKLRAGDFMALTDHINLMGANPLRGPATPGLARFIDLTQTYDTQLTALLFKAARSHSPPSGERAGVRGRPALRLHRGIYLAVSGPSYETPAEIRAFARLGADAVGMSTVPEAIVARQCGLRVAAMSCITNLAAGISRAPLSHQEVLETGELVKKLAADLLKQFANLYGKQ
jgi:purine-nucleoside phosphorylase